MQDSAHQLMSSGEKQAKLVGVDGKESSRSNNVRLEGHVCRPPLVGHVLGKNEGKESCDMCGTAGGARTKGARCHDDF